MSAISKDQQYLSKYGQFFKIFNPNDSMPKDMTSINRYEIDHESLESWKNDVLFNRIFPGIEDVNCKVLSEKSGSDFLIGGTLLHVACHCQHIQALDFLLSRGADFTAKNKNGHTALHLAFSDLILGYMPHRRIKCGRLNNELIESVLNAHVESGNRNNPRTDEGLSHFHIACASDHLEAVHLFLNSGASVNEAVSLNSSVFPGFTPLHFAANFCGYKTAKLLLNLGADINAKDAKGLTPLHVVVEQHLKLNEMKIMEYDGKRERFLKDNEQIITLFLQDTRVMNTDEKGFSKFHAACTLSDSSTAASCIKDVNINCAVNMDSPIIPGYTALHFAARTNIKTVKLLLKNGADIAAQDSDGLTPLDICIKKYSEKYWHKLLSTIPAFEDTLFSDNQTKLSDFIVTWRKPSKLKKFLKSKSQSIYLSRNCPLWPGYGLMHFAVHFSKSEFDDSPVKTCLKRGGTAMIQDAHGRTPLHLSFYQGKKELIDMFFKRQLEIVDIIDDDGLSHLHIACKRSIHERESVVRALLSRGANVNSIFRGKSAYLTSGSTPLHVAVEGNNFAIIKLLLEHGADANLRNAEGMTPLLRFTRLLPFGRSEKNKEIGKLMLASLCDLESIVRSESELGLLHFASYTGNADAVKRLLELGADPNAVFLCRRNAEVLYLGDEFHGSELTAMHLAVTNNYMEVIEILLEGGADLLHKNSKGTTPLYDVLGNNKEVWGYYHIIDIEIVRYFTTTLVSDEVLRKRAEYDCGLTLLHVACFLGDSHRIENVLADPCVNVNVQMHPDSPIWPGATPLHLLIQSDYAIENVERIMKMLLEFGADVTLMNSEGDTPLHQIWNSHYAEFRISDSTPLHLPPRLGPSLSDFTPLRLLLEYQKNFRVNPVNEEGLSHFHLACAVGEYTIVEKFLENGVDVNLPIDYLRKSITFQTPLRFMLQSTILPPYIDPLNHPIATTDVDLQLKTMDVLLKYGADVNVQDEQGSTPFIEVARCDSPRELLFEKLRQSGADVNYVDMNGKSALDILITPSRDTITNDELRIFLSGSHNLFNTYDPVYGTGIVSKVVEKHHRKFIMEAIMENPDLFSVDQLKGRTPVHNMVANHTSAISAVEYANYTERFAKMGFDVDAQDSAGRTAIYLAALLRNEQALYGLLIAGADINITDLTNHALITRIYEVRNSEFQYFRFYSTEDKRRLRFRTACHIITMQLCGLEINSENLEYAKRGLSDGQLQLHRNTISKELEDTKLVRIGKGSLTLRDFLSETAAVASGPSMIYDDRKAVDEFFGSIDYERFPHLVHLFKLQYRKMSKRLLLIDSATDSLIQILGSVNGFSMPDICCRMILRFLNNTEVKHLIASMSTNYEADAIKQNVQDNNVIVMQLHDKICIKLRSNMVYEVESQILSKSYNHISEWVYEQIK